jgi:hypothetical protein
MLQLVVESGFEPRIPKHDFMAILPLYYDAFNLIASLLPGQRNKIQYTQFLYVFLHISIL